MPRGARVSRAQAQATADSNGGVDVPNITPVGRDTWMRWVIYAYPGWGKTSLIASGAERYKTLIIRSSADLIPARALNSGADQSICDTWEEMTQVLEFLRYSDHGYEWVWWDNISIAQDKLLDDIWSAVIAERPDRGVLTPKGGLDRGEYGRNMERIQQWLRHMVGCRRFHFGVMAHPFEGQHPTNDEGGFLLRPYVQGKQMTEKLCGYANLVAFLELLENDEQQWRRLHTRESSRWYAKDQYDAFPKGYLDNPTVPKLMDAITTSMSGKPNTTTARRGRGRKGA